MVYTFSGLKTVFREDYRIEVQSLFVIFEKYVPTQKDNEGNNLKHELVPLPVDDYDGFKSIMEVNPEIWKRFLQHLYTSDPEEGPRLYEKIKEAIICFEGTSLGGVDPKKGRELLTEFMSRCYQHKQIQTNASQPNFGACEKCVDELKSLGIGFHKTRKHKKLFKEKEKDPLFWDLFLQYSR